MEKQTEIPLAAIIEDKSAPVSIGTLPYEQTPAFFDTDHGTIEYVIQGSLISQWKAPDGSDQLKPAIVTYHDVGLNYRACFQAFLTYPGAEKLLESFSIIHVHAPGQGPNATPLPESFNYPTLDQLADQVSQLLDHLKIRCWIGLGAGVGGNILLRCAMSKEAGGLLGLLLIGTNHRSVGWTEYLSYETSFTRLTAEQSVNRSIQDLLLQQYFSPTTLENNIDMVEAVREHLQKIIPKNLYAFLRVCLWRDDLDKRMTEHPPQCRAIVACGHQSIHLSQIETLNSRMSDDKTSFIKLYGCGNLVSEERPRIILEAFVLLLQGLGFVQSLKIDGEPEPRYKDVAALTANEKH
eukprot:gene9281-1555_t